MPASDRCRSDLTVGTIFFHQDFHGSTETKGRYFLVVSSTQVAMICFTTSTRPYLLEQFSNQVVHVPLGSSCLPKECVINCRQVYEMDDIILSNKLNCGTIKVSGVLSRDLISKVYSTVATSKVLTGQEKHLISDSLKASLQGQIEVQ